MHRLDPPLAPPASQRPGAPVPARRGAEAPTSSSWTGAVALAAAALGSFALPEATVDTWSDYLRHCAVQRCTLVRDAPVGAGPLSPPRFGPRADDVWVGGPAGQIFRSYDGGMTWEVITLAMDPTLSVIGFADGTDAASPLAVDTLGRVWSPKEPTAPLDALELPVPPPELGVPPPEWALHMASTRWAAPWTQLASASAPSRTSLGPVTTNGLPTRPEVERVPGQGGLPTADVDQATAPATAPVHSPLLAPSPEATVPCTWTNMVIGERMVVDHRDLGSLLGWCTDSQGVRATATDVTVVELAALSADERAALEQVRAGNRHVAISPDGALFSTGSDEAGGAWSGGDVRIRPASTPSRPLRSNWQLPAWAVGAGGVGLALVLAARSVRREPPTAEPEGDAVASEALRTDAPIVHPADDRLKWAPMAEGLARFLRNPATEGPLVVAITGEWGSGKSSMMRLVERELRTAGARPTWFNAWHHHDAKDLVPALLEQVIRDVSPPALTLAGLEVRARLLRGRLVRQTEGGPARLAGLAGLVGLAGALVVTAVEHVGGHLSEGQAQDWLALAVGGPATLAIWRGARHLLGTLGAQPLAVVEALRDAASVQATVRRVALTNAFARDFGDLCGALGPNRRVVVFIDDVDRCTPEAVERVLEGVNFLTTNANCFVVFGMSKSFVLRALSTRLDERLGVRPEHYLEKLVNLEVPIPVAGAQELRALDAEDAPPELLAPANSPSATLPWWSQLLAGLAGPQVRLLGGATLMMASAVGAFGWSTSALADLAIGQHGATAGPSGPTVADDGIDAPAGTGVGAADVPANLAGLDAGFVAPSPAATASGTARAGGASAQLPTDWPVDFPFTVALLVLSVLLSAFVADDGAPPVRDPPGLRDALDRWRPILTPLLRTPRAWKRFVNRVRFLVMRQQAWARPAAGPWEEEALARDALRWRPWTLPAYLGVLMRLRDARPQTPAPVDAMAEEIEVSQLVALAALHTLFDATPYAEALRPERIRGWFRGAALPELPSDSVAPDLRRRAIEAREITADVPPPPPDTVRAYFQSAQP